MSSGTLNSIVSVGQQGASNKRNMMLVLITYDCCSLMMQLSIVCRSYGSMNAHSWTGLGWVGSKLLIKMQKVLFELSVRANS